MLVKSSFEDVLAMDSFLDVSDLFPGGDGTVRLSRQGEIPCIDVVMIITGQNNDTAGGTVRDMAAKHPEFFLRLNTHKFAGRGQKLIPVMKSSQVNEFLMRMPGKSADEFKLHMARLVTRMQGGDQSMHRVIDDNAASKALVDQFARAELGLPTLTNVVGDDVGTMVGKKHRMIEDDAETMVARKCFFMADMESQITDLQVKRFNSLLKGVSDIATQFLGNASESDRMWLAESQKNYAKSCMYSLYGDACAAGGLSAITVPTYTDDDTPVTIGIDILFKKGVTDNIDNTTAKRIGRIAARMYREKHCNGPRQEPVLIN